jgi:hypothetical protein
MSALWLGLKLWRLVCAGKCAGMFLPRPWRNSHLNRVLPIVGCPHLKSVLGIVAALCNVKRLARRNNLAYLVPNSFGRDDIAHGFILSPEHRIALATAMIAPSAATEVHPLGVPRCLQ